MNVLNMGAGRPPKPTAVKELQGTARKGRRNAAEPKLQPEKLAPRVPREWRKGGADEWPEAVAVWRYLARLVDPMSIATAADVEAFRGLVEDTVLHREHMRKLHKEGLVLDEVTKAGVRLMEHPSGHATTRLRKTIMMQQARFGLSPSDRQRVATLAGATGEADPLAQFSRGSG